MASTMVLISGEYPPPKATTTGDVQRYARCVIVNSLSVSAGDFGNPLHRYNAIVRALNSFGNSNTQFKLSKTGNESI